APPVSEAAALMVTKSVITRICLRASSPCFDRAAGALSMLDLLIVLVRSSGPPATSLSTAGHLQHARPSHTRRSVLQHRTHHSGDRPVNLLRCVCQPYPWQGLRVFNAAEAFGLVDLEGAIVS